MSCFEEEQVRNAGARQADEIGVVKLDDSFHFLVVAEADAHR